MKLSLAAAALALSAAALPTLATAAPFQVDFEKTWDSGEVVGTQYAGLEFVNVLGLSNVPGFPAFSNAPSPLGVAYAQLDGTQNTAAYINIADGLSNGLAFWYSTPQAVSEAVQAYSGLSGTGTLLGSYDLAASGASYDVWTQAVFNFSGTAQSIVLTNTAGVAAFDNISSVPEPGSLSLMLAGALGLGFMARRRRG